MDDINIKRKKVICEIQEPSVEWKDSYLSALEEFHKEGWHKNQNAEEISRDFPKFIQRLKDDSLGINLTEGHVPQTTYWIVDKDGYAGRISIRHRLNENLLKLGGHIGYDVRPSKRGNGYGKKALELILPKVHALGLTKVLLSCDSTNIGSKKIIEANGGILENEVAGEDGQPSKLRYWITLQV